MPRRVLIAEQADTLRSVAETVLRQNGYDVISVTAAEKAREVLDRPVGEAASMTLAQTNEER